MFNNRYGLEDAVLSGNKTMTRRFNPSYRPGEEVAVAMSYSQIHDLYHADDHDYRNWFRYEPGWFNKMFVKPAYMPERILVTGKRAGRLQDITGEDCLREGVMRNIFTTGYDDAYCIRDGEYMRYFATAREAFAWLTDRINGKGTWESNPKVWVYEFEMIPDPSVFGGLPWKPFESLKKNQRQIKTTEK